MAASSTPRKPMTPAQKRAAAAKRAATIAAKSAASSTPLDEAPTSVSDWKKGKQGEDLRLPSGNVCRIRRVGMREWVREDIIPDSLKPIVDDAIARGQNINPKTIEKLKKDTSKIAEMFELMDRVVALVVMLPAVIYHRYQRDGEWIDIPMDDRDEGTLYTDDIDDMDKIFIFNFAAGGVRDLERFRQELGSSMGTVRRGEDVEG